MLFLVISNEPLPVLEKMLRLSIGFPDPVTRPRFLEHKGSTVAAVRCVVQGNGMAHAPNATIPP